MTMRKVIDEDGEAFITCEEVITHLLRYLAGETSAEENVEFERHLAVCDSCVAYIRTYKEAIRLGRSVVALERPPELERELVRAILAARKA